MCLCTDYVVLRMNSAVLWAKSHMLSVNPFVVVVLIVLCCTPTSLTERTEHWHRISANKSLTMLYHTHSISLPLFEQVYEYICTYLSLKALVCDPVQAVSFGLN